MTAVRMPGRAIVRPLMTPAVMVLGIESGGLSGSVLTAPTVLACARTVMPMALVTVRSAGTALVPPPRPSAAGLPRAFLISAAGQFSKVGLAAVAIPIAVLIPLAGSIALPASSIRALPRP